MGDLVPITQHKKYSPSKVRACLFYGIDPNLDENARALYHFLLAVSTLNYGITYIKWSTTEDAIQELNHSEWGREHTTLAIKSAFSLLRKNRYLRHTYNRELDARVLELLDYIGENARS
jgi:hypothetical protein